MIHKAANSPQDVIKSPHAAINLHALFSRTSRSLRLSMPANWEVFLSAHTPGLYTNKLRHSPPTSERSIEMITRKKFNLDGPLVRIHTQRPVSDSGRRRFRVFLNSRGILNDSAAAFYYRGAAARDAALCVRINQYWAAWCDWEILKANCSPWEYIQKTRECGQNLSHRLHIKTNFVFSDLKSN